MEFSRPRARDEFRPFVHSSSTDAECSACRRLGFEMPDYVTFEHRPRGYPMGYLQVNDGIPPLIASFPPMEETKGERIRRLREARGLTQPALAKLLISMGAPSTLTKAAIAKWENGDTQNMQNETFVLLVKALGTDPEYILWGQPRTPPETPASERLKRKA